MYLRTTQRRNTDGSIVRYIQLAHNHRVEGVTQAEVLVNLGREDRLDLRPVYHRIEPRIRAHVLLSAGSPCYSSVSPSDAPQ